MLHAVPITVVLSSLEGLLECHQVLVAETGGLALVYEKLGPHTYHLKSLDRRIDNLPANDQDPKHYFLDGEPCRAMYIVCFLLVVFILFTFLIIFVFSLFDYAYYFFSRSFCLLDILLFLSPGISAANYYVLDFE